MRKCLKAMLLFITVIAMLTGCGSKKEISATDSAKALFDLIFLADKTEATSKLGMSEEECSSIIEPFKQGQTATFKAIFESAGLDISDEKLEEIYIALIEAFNKVNYTIEETEGADKETKTIIFKTTYVDFQELMNTMIEQYAEEAQNITDESQLAEALANIFIESFKNYTPAEESTITVELEFSLQEGLINGKSTKAWLPSNSFEFGKELGAAITGQK